MTLVRVVGAAVIASGLLAAAGCGGAPDAEPTPDVSHKPSPYADGGAVPIYRECIIAAAEESAYRELIADGAIIEALDECRQKRLLAIEAAAENAVGRIAGDDYHGFAKGIVDNIEILAMKEQGAVIKRVHDISGDSLPLRYRVCLLHQVRGMRGEDYASMAIAAAFELCRKIRAALLDDATMLVARERLDIDPNDMIVDVDNKMRAMMLETHAGTRP